MSTKLYNNEIKERYLNERFENEDSRTTIKYVFKSAELIEDVLNKDLYNFSLPEIGKVIKNANPHSIGVARSHGRIISKYISWAIEPMGLRENNIHPMKGINDSWYDTLVDKTKKIHYSKDELIELIERLPNAQDQAFLALMFEGVVGDKFEELRNISYYDVDWNNNELTIRNRDNFKIKLDNTFMRYIKNAYEAQTYRNYDKETGDYKERDLLDSNYIFRNIKSRAKEGEPVSLQVFYNRLNNIKGEFDLEYLTPNALKQSGMIHMAAEIIKEKKKNNKEIDMSYADFEKIGIKYDYSKIHTVSHVYYNTNLMKTFLTEEKLFELYGIKIKF
ncbi:hypothetical protein KDN24_06725 [Bacillus sp. Bva_UNVM-123]|uniref:phage lytic cycle repressor MrpR family protein n=1 Tax=Bacillus sp. Bva_UNVM-123 TaxID=2829798 RepID=UPI00391F02D1